MKLIQLPTQAFEQRLLEEMNENPAFLRSRERDTRMTSSKMKIMMIMTMENRRMEADDIKHRRISKYDDTPDYKKHKPTITVMMTKITIHPSISS
jgi:RNA polymerase sigma-54 factor